MKRILLTFLLTMVVFSCQDTKEQTMPKLLCDDDNQEKSTTAENHKTKEITINLSGRIEQPAVTRGLKLQNNLKESNPELFVKWEDGDEIYLKVLIQKPNTNQHVFVAGKGIVSVKRNGNAPSSTETVNFSFKGTCSNPHNHQITNEWCMTASLGISRDYDTPFILEPFIDPLGIKPNEKEMELPFMFPWRQINNANINSGSFVDINDVVFKPVGTLLSLNIESEFHDPILLKKIQVTSNVFCCNEGFDTEHQQVNKGKYMSSTHLTKNDVISNGLHKSFVKIKEGLGENNKPIGQIEDGKPLEELFVWANTFKNINGTPHIESLMQFTPICRDPFTNANNKYKKEFVPPYKSLIWQYSKANNKQIDQTDGLSDGKVYKVNMIAKSSEFPIISEIYHNGAHSIVELYNPSNRAIDLTNLYIAKIKGNGKMIPAPIGDGTYVYRMEGVPHGTNGSVLLPLYLTSSYSKTTINTYKSDPPSAGKAFTSYPDNNVAYNYNTLMGLNSSLRNLEPGKTLLIGGSGYLTSDGAFNKNAYNSNAPKDDIEKSKAKNNIAAFVVVDNSGYSYETYNPNTSKNVPSTVDLEKNDGIVLIQKTSSGAFEIVDVYPYDSRYKSTPFYSSRYDGIVYPKADNDDVNDKVIGRNTTGEYTAEGYNKQWYSGYETIHSIGSRYRFW